MIVMGVLNGLSNGGSTAAPIILLFISNFVFGLSELDDLRKRKVNTRV